LNESILIIYNKGERMKRIIEDNEAGMISLMGKRVTFFCANYIYTGVLTGINDTCVEITDPAIVFETGPFSDEKYSDEQQLPMKKHFIQTGLIESFGAKDVD